jgi:MYXO-CTERM domain-containing protein
VAGERRSGDVSAVLCLLTMLVGASSARAVPMVSIDGGSGLPGGTVAAVTSLADDPERVAVAADLIVRFPDPPLIVDPTSCTLAARLNSTHELTAEVPSAGELHVTIAPSDGPTPLDDGPLATCDIGIALGAPAGTAALDLSVELRNAAGEAVPSEAIDGAIIIESAEPTPTATHTETPTNTPTVTLTPLPTVTDTPTASPTATLFQPTVLFDDFGSSCAVTRPGAHEAWPLLGLLVLVWRRRRAR